MRFGIDWYSFPGIGFEIEIHPLMVTFLGDSVHNEDKAQVLRGDRYANFFFSFPDSRRFRRFTTIDVSGRKGVEAVQIAGIGTAD